MEGSTDDIRDFFVVAGEHENIKQATPLSLGSPPPARGALLESRIERNG